MTFHRDQNTKSLMLHTFIKSEDWKEPEEFS